MLEQLSQWLARGAPPAVDDQPSARVEVTGLGESGDQVDHSGILPVAYQQFGLDRWIDCSPGSGALKHHGHLGDRARARFAPR